MKHKTVNEIAATVIILGLIVWGEWAIRTKCIPPKHKALFGEIDTVKALSLDSLIKEGLAEAVKAKAREDSIAHKDDQLKKPLIESLNHRLDEWGRLTKGQDTTIEIIVGGTLDWDIFIVPGSNKLHLQQYSPYSDVKEIPLGELSIRVICQIASEWQDNIKSGIQENYEKWTK